MPLDDDGRRYANNLFNRDFENTLKDYQRENAQIRANFTGRGTLASGGYIRALAEAAIKRTDLLAQAKADALLEAYEKSGLHFDDTALREITNEVTEFCNSQQRNTVGYIKRGTQQIFGGQSAPAAMENAIARQIERGVSSTIARVRRDLQIKRDEIILDGKRARKVYAAGLGKEWDVFISHASEDKEEFVRPLAAELERSGLRVWYDETTLKVGDSLRSAIDEGLAHSRFGIVVLSESFFAKQWPQRELDGLVSKEVAGLNVILPVWHKVSLDEVRRYSLTLAGRVAAKSMDGLGTVVKQLRDAMGL